ncbi:unnamed protein product [Blepharisma stoltei]|uniref:Dynein assembly factor 1, axonemal homolog n=1 Tax=Blepharisma stoltei TaxID=1481888 RepID=A0AAU9J9G3_9CILI|nr:unnamed protein product [Blepharisma stoltei]
MIVDDFPRISNKFLNQLLGSDVRIYYNTRYLNDRLYLHYKGFHQIENLDEFTGLKVLYMEGNSIKHIQGLESCQKLRCIYLQQNCIEEISGLDTLTDLHTLNLAENFISSIKGLSNTQKLSTLTLKANQIGVNGIDDLKGLLDAQSLEILDLSDNKISDVEIIPEILEKLPQLCVLYLHGNPVCRKIENYRKILIAKLSNLKYLDDRPVFDEDRRFAMAFLRGGIQAEREERRQYEKEVEEKRMLEHHRFREIAMKHRNDRLGREENKTNGSTTISEGSSDEWNSSSEATEVSYIGDKSQNDIQLPDLEEVKIVKPEEFKEKEENYIENLLNAQNNKEENRPQEFNKIIIEEVEECPYKNKSLEDNLQEIPPVINEETIEDMIKRHQEELDELD